MHILELKGKRNRFVVIVNAKPMADRKLRKRAGEREKEKERGRKNEKMRICKCLFVSPISSSSSCYSVFKCAVAVVTSPLYVYFHYKYIR